MASAVKMPSIAQMQNIVDKAQAVKSTVLFPRWKDVPAVAGALSKAKDLAGQHARLLASDKPDGRAQAQKVWTSLASVYWELLFALLDAQTAPRAGRLPARLSFDETERLFIDFGILADGTLPFHRDFDAGMTLGSRCEAGIFPYLSFSDFIAECWAMILGAPAPAPVAGPAASERVKLLQEQLDKAQFRRDDLVMEIADEFVPNTPLDLRKLTSDMDRFLTSAMKVLTRAPEYREASESARQGILQERAAYLEAEKSVLLMISSAKQNAANPLPQPHMERVLGFHERTKVLAKKILYCQNDARKIARRAKKITDACSGLSAQMKRGELKNMLVKKREYLTVPGKTARCDTSPFCPPESLPIDYQRSGAELEALCDMDMDMFSVPRVRMYGVPRVIFVPGQGVGTYDWSDHSMLVPAFPVGGEDKSLTYALGTFRWDSDEDRKLKNPYEQIKENRKKSLLVMAASFYKDYSLWMTKEKKGYRILPRETHKVFEQMFAPGKDED